MEVIKQAVCETPSEASCTGIICKLHFQSIATIDYRQSNVSKSASCASQLDPTYLR